MKKDKEIMEKNKEIFEIVDNLEEYTGDKLLLKDNEIVSSLRKDGYLITIEVNGEVEIENKKGREIPLYDDKLKKAIQDGTFQNKYNIIHNNWLEICYYEENENGEDDYLNCDSEVYYGIDEIGEDKEEIKQVLMDWLEDCIKENQEEEEME